MMTQQTTLLAGCIMPHPPVIIPGVERGHMKATQTVAAMKQLAAEVAALQPDTLVVITPHAPMFSDYLFVYDESPLSGNLSAFGVPEIRLALEQDQPLQQRFIDNCAALDIQVGSLNAGQLSRFAIDTHLDHGAMVPLYFLQNAWRCSVLVMASAALPMPDLYATGRQLRQAASELGRHIVVVASGDQSHKANEASPYGSCTEGARYDELLVQALHSSDRKAILSIDPEIRKRAAECGYRSIVMLCGAFSDVAVRSNVLSYEAPYGIGYCVARMLPDPAKAAPDEDPMQAAAETHRVVVGRKMAKASVPVQIAREMLDSKIRHNRTCDQAHFAAQLEQEPWLRQSAGVFVSLKKQGELRGCIGTTEATTTCIAAEIMQNTISAATRDPRFEPITADELPDIQISIDVLGTPLPVASLEELDPEKYGIIVRSGRRTGLLLPALEGIDHVDEQVAVAKRKAGIQPQEPCTIEKFTVSRYT